MALEEEFETEVPDEEAEKITTGKFELCDVALRNAADETQDE